MKHITVINGWSFEVVAVRARRAKCFGDKYDAVATITVADGEPHIEGLLAVDYFTLEDRRAFSTYLSRGGFNRGTFSRLKKGRRKVTKRKASVNI